MDQFLTGAITDRLEIKLEPGSQDPRKHPAMPFLTYAFTIERADGKTLRWSVNGVDLFSFPDPSPIARYAWDRRFSFDASGAKVCFDNVRVTPL